MDQEAHDAARLRLVLAGHQFIVAPPELDQVRYRRARQRAINAQMNATVELPLHHGEDFDFATYQQLFVGGTSYTVDANGEHFVYYGAYCIRDTKTTWTIEKLNDEAVNIVFEQFEDAVAYVAAYYQDIGATKQA